MMVDRIASALMAAASNVNPQQVADVRRNFAIHVHCGNANSDRVEQLGLLLLILRRVFRNITCNVDFTQYGPNKPRFTMNVRRVDTDDHANLVIVLSDQKHATRRPTIYVDSRGWTAYLSPDEPWTSARQQPNSIGAQYAAALATQEAFNRAFATLLTKATNLARTTRFCLVAASPPDGGTNQPDLNAPVDIDVLVVGVGAVGQAALHALASLPSLTGRIDLVDHEAIAPENADRYLFAGGNLEGKGKAAFGRELLAGRHPFLQIHANVDPPTGYQAAVEPPRWTFALTPGAGGWMAVPLSAVLTPMSTYHEYRASDGASGRHLAVAAVDSTQVRIDIQFGGHDVVVNPWTDTDLCMRYGVGIHRIGTRACVACQYRSYRKHAPDRYEFYAGLIGWDVDRVKPFLDDPNKVLDVGTLQEVATSLGLDEAQALSFAGQRLQRFLDAQCAQATIRESDRLGTSPAPHVAALAGIWTAAYIVLEALQAVPNDPIQVVADALHPTIPKWETLGTANPDCLCQDPRIPKG